MSRIHLLVLYLRYGGREETLAALRAFLPALRCETTLLVIDNQQDQETFAEERRSYTLLSGDNTAWEFSGWQRGLDYAWSRGLVGDLVLFVNDSFLTPGPTYLRDYAGRELVERCMHDRVALGRLDSFGRSLRAFGYRFDDWMCTNCFLVPRPALEELGSLVSVDTVMLDTALPRDLDLRVLDRRRVSRADLEHAVVRISVPDSATVSRSLRVDVSGVSRTCAERVRSRSDGLMQGWLEVAGHAVPVDHTTAEHGWKEAEGFAWLGRTSSIRLPARYRRDSVSVALRCHPLVAEDARGSALKLQLATHSGYFRVDAPVSVEYRRAILDWLTAGWHRSVVIDNSNWQHLRKKVQAIWNEALLTARLRARDFSVERYGDTRYY